MRLRLLCRIAKQEEPCVSDLWSCLDQPQPVISQHLAVLKQKGIVTSEVRGNRRVYSIVDPFIRQIVGSLIDTPMAIPDEVLNGPAYALNLAKLFLADVPWYEWNLQSNAASGRIASYIQALKFLPEFQLA